MSWNNTVDTKKNKTEQNNDRRNQTKNKTSIMIHIKITFIREIFDLRYATNHVRYISILKDEQDEAENIP